MTQTPGHYEKQLPFFIGVLGALIGAALFYGFTVDAAIAVVLGAPIGLLVGVIAYRAVPRIIHRNDTQANAQLNGAAPKPTIEEQAKPDFRMKIKN